MANKTYKFPGCGCEIEQVGMDGNMPLLRWTPTLENIPLDCSRTWDLISDGNTKGVFQLESRLGSMLAKKLKPRSIEHYAALISIMRPGCLEAMRDKKSVTHHYIDRKNGVEPVTYFHPSLKNALQSTYGELVYQEQAMQIARDIAGFDLQQADVLRKAIGKKLASVMAKVKIEFLEGCAKMGIVTKEEAEEIFAGIEKSQRYSFNKSHAISYALNGYLSAYVKAHFPRMFFTSYLYFAQEKSNPHEEINELVNNAKINNVDVVCPSLAYMNEHFRLLENKIRFGVADIKGIGNAVIIKARARITATENILKKEVKDMNWVEFLVFISPYINKTASTALIASGALDFMKEHRTRMLYEHELYGELTKKEKEWIMKLCLLNPITSFKVMLEKMVESPTGRKGACANKNRKTKIEEILKLVENPPYSLKDSPVWIACQEEDLLGISLSCSIVDGCSTDDANCTCKQFLDGFNNKIIILAVKIDKLSEIRTKKGKNPGQKMAFITVSDNSAQIDGVVVFPNVWSEYRHLFVVDNTVLLVGSRGKNDASLIVEKVLQI